MMFAYPRNRRRCTPALLAALLVTLAACGHCGTDDVGSGATSDAVQGSSNVAMVEGGGGSDVLRSNARFSNIWGGGGADTLYAGHGQSHVFGEEGDDVLYAGDGKNRLLGGPGNDRLYGGGGESESILDGGRGNDVIKGGAGDDLLAGGPGDDLLDAGSGIMSLNGGAGDDTFLVGRDAASPGVHELRDFGREGSDLLVVPLLEQHPGGCAAGIRWLVERLNDDRKVSLSDVRMALGEDVVAADTMFITVNEANGHIFSESDIACQQ